ncbi:hypothetical protein Tco_0536961 [Tanacetum coccineum]
MYSGVCSPAYVDVRHNVSGDMSGSEPGEMASESLKVVVFPKFDMHIYTLELTLSELKTTVNEYCIPLDLHPHLPPPGMTMNRLPSRYIGLYIEQLEQGDLHDDFLTNYNENDVARLSEFLVPLRPSPCHLLYVCGLTMACQHPKLQYNIRDQYKNVISMDTFLKLPTWIETVVSKGDPLLEDQCPKPRVTPPLAVHVEIPKLTPFQKNLEKPNSKIATARVKKDQQNLEKAEAKRDGAGNAEGLRKKRRVQKHNELTQSSSEEAFSDTPLHQAALEVAKRPVTVVEAAKDTSS